MIPPLSWGYATTRTLNAGVDWILWRAFGLEREDHWCWHCTCSSWIFAGQYTLLLLSLALALITRISRLL